MIKKVYAVRDFNLPLILLDRDGTLNKDPKGYTSNISELELTEFASKLRRLGNVHSFQIVIVSNQSGIGRGLHSVGDFFSFTEELIPSIQGISSTVQMVLACPHTPEMKCLCRKPHPMMLGFATKGYDLSKACFIGDSDSDKQAAISSNIRFFDVNLSIENRLNLWLEDVCDSKFRAT